MPSFDEYLRRKGGVEALVSSENTEYFYESARYGNDQWDSLSDEEKDKAMYDAAYAHFEERYNMFAGLDLPNPMTVYRAMRLKDVEAIETDGFGTSWAWHESAAIAHCGYGGVTYVFRGEVYKSEVDWDQTIMLALDPSLEEDEIRLKDFGKVKITGWRKGKETQWHEPKPELREVTASKTANSGLKDVLTRGGWIALDGQCIPLLHEDDDHGVLAWSEDLADLSDEERNSEEKDSYAEVSALEQGHIRVETDLHVPIFQVYKLNKSRAMLIDTLERAVGLVHGKCGIGWGSNDENYKEFKSLEELVQWLKSPKKTSPSSGVEHSFSERPFLEDAWKRTTGAKKFYHASTEAFEPGTVLVPSGEPSQFWEREKFLEEYRPEGHLPRSQSVFMTDNAKAAKVWGRYVYEVEPQGKVEKNDIGWFEQLFYLDDPEWMEDDEESGTSREQIEEFVSQAVKGYWSGKPNDQHEIGYEYRAPNAKVVKQVTEWGKAGAFEPSESLNKTHWVEKWIYHPSYRVYTGEPDGKATHAAIIEEKMGKPMSFGTKFDEVSRGYAYISKKEKLVRLHSFPIGIHIPDDVVQYYQKKFPKFEVEMATAVTAAVKTAEVYSDCNVGTPDLLPSPEEFNKKHGYERHQKSYPYLRNFFNTFESPIIIHRALKMAGPKPVPYSKGFGIYWSWNEDKAIPYEGETDPDDQAYGQTFIFKAQVPFEGVDWARTVGANLDNAMEEEITLRKGTPIKILGWRHRDKAKWQPPTSFMKNVTAGEE